ncbi:MAG: HEAT repeat domain-containing protein [Gemmatimonadales bacterium]
MTAGAPTPALLIPSQVAELLQTMVKALRAFQMYLPNNPIYQRAIQNVRGAFGPIWAAGDELVLTIAETEVLWEDEIVYQQISRSESLAWTLFKDGMRVLTIQKGAEDDELVRFLETVNRARFLSPEAGDDLMTLLWEQEFVSIRYHFIDFLTERDAIEGSRRVPGEGDATAVEARRDQVRDEAPARPKGIVDLEDFDATLYFLDEAEINRLAKEVQDEYARDARLSALTAVFDLLELQADATVRAEILAVLETLFPNLLSKGEFRTVATVIRDARLVLSRADELPPELRRRLEALDTQLSHPAIVAQLVQSLDEASQLAGETDVTDLLGELRAGALGALIESLPRVATPRVRTLVEATVDRLAAAHGTEVLRLLREPPGEALPAVVALCGRLALQPAVPGLGELLGHADAPVRLAAVQALETIGTPGAMGQLERAIDDADRSVRLVAVRAAGARGYKGALKRVEAVVLGKAVKEMDLTEKMAFFEAYGAIAGGSALKTLAGMLLPRGLFKLTQPSDLRACAAIALGKIRTPEAREVLASAAEDKDLVVRNAVNRALRESPA